MNKIKDIIYDKNDILIAFIIIAVTAFIIYTRIGIIMDYPATLVAEAESKAQAAEQQRRDSNSEGNSDNDADTDQNAGSDTNTGETDGQNSAQGNGSPITLEIPSGTNLREIGQIFVDAGLASSVEEFCSTVQAVGLETKIRAGTFELPADSTLPQAIAAVAN